MPPPNNAWYVPGIVRLVYLFSFLNRGLNFR
jgi:hypothetical protein